MDSVAGRAREYFPWAVGVLAAATAALAIGIAAADRGVDPKLAAPLPVAADAVQSAAPPPLPPALAPSVTEQPRTMLEPLNASPTDQASSAPPTTRIWECVVDGRRTFSDSPCGAAARARDIAEPNRMDSAPLLPTMTRYGVPGSYYPPPAADAADAGDSGWSDDGVLLVVAHGLRRPDRRPRHDAGRRMNSHAMAHH
ncbi:MAG: hypothetical protein ABSH33_10520 [Steroidobacteraceae bacterium]